MQKTVSTQETELPSKVRFPTEEYDRSEFYKSYSNIRYLLKVNLTNGAQAEDIPVGIEDLVEFLGDVESLIDDIEGISVDYRNHTYWTAKLNTVSDTHMENFDWRKLESSIEEIAEKHGIALRKQLSMSGRGYKDPSHRCVTVNYSFGTYSDDNEYWISNENNPMCKVEWVGGSIGDRENLNRSQVEIKSVETKKVTLMDNLIRYIKSFF